MTPQQKTKGILLILAAYVIIAIIGFFVVYFVKTTFFPAPKAPATQTVTKPISTVPKGWKTYQNPKKEFTFSYPPSLKLKETSYQLGVTNIELRGTDLNKPPLSTDFQMLFVPKTLAMAAGQDFGGYYNSPNNTTRTIASPISKNKTQQNFTKLTNITIDGHKAFTYRSASANATKDQGEVGVFVEDGSNVLLISAPQASKTTLDKIMKTFQF